MGKTTINELMGSSGTKGKARSLSLDDLGELLGERLPKLDFNPVGRMRLMQALRNRFGDAYRSLPGIDNVMREFDEHAKFAVKLQEMKQIKAHRK